MDLGDEAAKKEEINISSKTAVIIFNLKGMTLRDISADTYIRGVCS